MAEFLTGKIIRKTEALGRELLGDGAASATASSAAEAFDDVPIASLEREAGRRAGSGVAGAASSERTRRYVLAAGSVVSASFLKEFAKICSKAGAAGAIVDGFVGGWQGLGHWQEGTIDGTQLAKHVAAESGCGFVTSASGTAGTIAVFMVTGSMGPAALAAGMGASMGSRYLYREVVGETLPDEEELERRRRQAHGVEDPDDRAQSPETDESGPSFEDIGIDNPFSGDEATAEEGSEGGEVEEPPATDGNVGEAPQEASDDETDSPETDGAGDDDAEDGASSDAPDEERDSSEKSGEDEDRDEDSGAFEPIGPSD